MREKHLNTFDGVIDSDTDPLFIQPGNYLDALNLVSGLSGMGKHLEAINGQNTLDAPWPAGAPGDNTVIGAVEDKQNRSLIYFIHNADDLHTILRFTDLQSDVNETLFVAQSDLFNFSVDHRIQGEIIDGKYLFWTDGRAIRDGLTAESSLTGNFPCKLNIEKAIRVNKYLECLLIPELPEYSDFVSIFDNLNTYAISIYDETGALLFTEEFEADGTYLGDPAGGLAWLKAEIEGSDLADFLIVEECDGCKLRLTGKFFGCEVFLTTSDPDLMLVPENYYPLDLSEYHFQMLKEPPRFPPTVSFSKSTDTAINNVQRSCFQFRLRYIYDDGERSAWGPISNVAINLGVDGKPVDDLNAILIDFTDDWLSDPDRLCIIEKVEIAVRDGNDSIFKSIKTLERCELGMYLQRYLWTNDQEYSAVPSDDGSQGSSDTQVLKLFDEVPLVCGAIATVSGTDGDQRLFVGDTLEGFDCPDCVNVDFTIEESALDGIVDIIGTVRILDEEGGSIDTIDYHEPWYPLGGFVVYLAGTPYYGISDNPADDSGTGAFRIKGVPKGVYIMRVASHQCGFNDDLGSTLNLNNGLVWQKTSSPVLDCAGSHAATGIHTERVIDLTGFSGTEFDLDTEVGYGTIDIQNMFSTDDTKKLVEVYFIDSGADHAYVNGDADDYTSFRSDVLSGLAIEHLRATISDGVVSPQNMDTDHNGYAFFILENAGTALDTGSTGLTDISFGPLGDSPLSWLLMDNGSGALDSDNTGVGYTFVDLTTPGSVILFVLATSETWTDTYRRTLTGSVKDAEGAGVSGVLVMYERNGRQEMTDVFGAFSIAIYPPNSGSAGDRDEDSVYVTYPNDVSYDFPPDPTSNLALIGPWDDYVVPDFEFEFSGGLSVDERLLKNGATYKVGIVYEAKGNQTCGVVPLDSIYIPFCTESGEIRKNRVLWDITSVPPDWATHYRLVRTKNLVHSRFFQWVTDEVKFGIISNPAEAPTFVAFSAANWDHIFLRVNSKDVEGEDGDLFLFFQERKEGYTPLIGDRVRFMLDESSNPVATNKILELDIAGRYIDGDDYYVVVPRVEFNTGIEPQAGWSFEFYTPKGVEEPFYYETGDAYEILEPGTENRRHAGPVADQVLNTSGAQGYLQGGDTYWRYKSFNTVGAGVRFYTENATVSPYHTQACEDVGRAFIEAVSDQQWRYNRTRFSDLYVAESDINGLCSFGSLNYMDIDRQFGPIVSLKHVGNILLALAWYKPQSFYIKKGDVLDLRGGQTLGLSDQVLNVADEFMSELGCQHPESVAVDHGRVYWWDGFRGRVGRYSQAGVEPIDRGLFNKFQEIAKERSKLDPSVEFAVGGFDRKIGMYLLTFNEFDGEAISASPYTFAFSEVQNGWKTRFSFIPDCYGSVGAEFFLFNSDGHWRQMGYAGDGYNNFFGVQYDSMVKFAANPRPDAVKDWYCIDLRTNERWEAPAIEIPENLDYKSGMLSRLKTNKFSSYEGDWCADFLRDMNDTAAEFEGISDPDTRAATALLRGRPLKGGVLIVTLQSDVSREAHQVKLWHSIIEYAASMKTGM